MATCSISSAADDEINDPGAAPYGNFINYYTFNPPENRLSLIPSTLLRDLTSVHSDAQQSTLILDVGCNSGVSDFKQAVTALHASVTICYYSISVFIIIIIIIINDDISHAVFNAEITHMH